MRTSRHGLESREQGRGEPEVFQFDRPSTAIEQPDDDALTVHGRHGGDAHVEFALLEPHADPSVLRPSPFRDVEVREELDA